MKKKELCAVACLFWLAGCSDPASDEFEIVKNLFPVQFSVQLQKEVLPFSSTRSMPPNTVPYFVPDAKSMGESPGPADQKTQRSLRALFGAICVFPLMHST